MNQFRKFAGKHVRVAEAAHSFYIPTEDELEEMGEEVVEDLHPEGTLEPGYEFVGVSGAFEEGELVQSDAFLAIHEGDDKAYISDEGTITELDVRASALTIEIDDEEDDD